MVDMGTLIPAVLSVVIGEEGQAHLRTGEEHKQSDTSGLYVNFLFVCFCFSIPYSQFRPSWATVDAVDWCKKHCMKGT